MHIENIWLSCSKPSNYQERLRCHACYIRRTNERRKVENSAVFWYTRNCNYQINSINIMLTCLLDAPAAWIITSVIYISIVMNIMKIIVRIIKFDLRPYDLHARGPCCVNPFLQMHSPFRHSDSATCWNDHSVHLDCDRHHQHVFDQVRFHWYLQIDTRTDLALTRVDPRDLRSLEVYIRVYW